MLPISQFILTFASSPAVNALHISNVTAQINTPQKSIAQSLDLVRKNKKWTKQSKVCSRFHFVQLSTLFCFIIVMTLFNGSKFMRWWTEHFKATRFCLNYTSYSLKRVTCINWRQFDSNTKAKPTQEMSNFYVWPMHTFDEYMLLLMLLLQDALIIIKRV